MRMFKTFEPAGYRDGFLCGTVTLSEPEPSRYAKTIAIARYDRFEAHIQVSNATWAKMLKNKKKWRDVYVHCGILAKGTVASIASFETGKPLEGKPSLEWRE
jgi:hypothetical protein